jgi:hypothetical protein
MPSQCWLCVHCDQADVVEMMRFVEEKSAVMHIDVLATEITAALRAAHPGETGICEELIKQHVARHVVTPVASITRITRDLLDICETLRPTRETLQQQQQRRRKRRRDGDGGDGEAAEAAPEQDDIGTYLRTVGQVMQIYRLHSRLLQAPA